MHCRPFYCLDRPCYEYIATSFLPLVSGTDCNVVLQRQRAFYLKKGQCSISYSATSAKEKPAECLPRTFDLCRIGLDINGWPLLMEWIGTTELRSRIALP